MKEIDSKRIIEFFISLVVIFTFLTSLFIFSYTEIYNRSDIAKYNYGIVESRSMSAKEICLAAKQPLGGMAFYRDLFPLGFALIEISAVLVVALFILSMLKTKNIYFNKRAFVFFALIVFLSWVLLFGAWNGVDSWFYNCAKTYY